VLVNSVALEGDGCHICSEAEAELIEISHKLNCSREERGPGRCGRAPLLPASAPVLLQVSARRAAPAPGLRPLGQRLLVTRDPLQIPAAFPAFPEERCELFRGGRRASGRAGHPV